MAKFLFGMNQSLDGYVDHTALPVPDAALFRHFVEQAQGLTGSIYGRRLYELMRYWDEDRKEWSSDERAFAAAWRAQRKWVVSRTLTSVGPNATLVGQDIEASLRRLKDEVAGEVEVGGPMLAAQLADWGLVDAYLIYLHPVVLGQGTRYFAAPRPPLRLTESLRIGGDVIRLTYVPA